MSICMSFFLVYPGAEMSDRHGIWVPIVGGVAFAVSTVSLLATAFSDPGIIPRRIGQVQRSPNGDKMRFRKPPRTQDVVVDGQVYRLKFCETCNIYRPPRCIHCSICDNCVEVYDHHCPWVGNCIGKRNYRYFVLFLNSTSFLVLFVLIMCALEMRHRVSGEQTRDSTLSASSAWFNIVKSNPVSFLLALTSGIFVFFVGGLCGFHLILVCLGQTTNEQMKRLFPRGSPFSAGAIRNISQLCCSLPVPSRIVTRRKVTAQHETTRQPIVVTLEVDDSVSDASVT